MADQRVARVGVATLWTLRRPLGQSRAGVLLTAVFAVSMLAILPHSWIAAAVPGEVPPVVALQPGIFLTVSCSHLQIEFNRTSWCHDQTNLSLGYGAANGNVIWYTLTSVADTGYTFAGNTVTGACLGSNPCSGSSYKIVVQISATCRIGSRCQVYLTGSAVAATTSRNWAGYGVSTSSGQVTQANGSWIQPTITCVGSGLVVREASWWVGIDGLAGPSDPYVEQGGTLAGCSANNLPYYEAFYEFYPLSAVVINSTVLPISAGDTISVDVEYYVNNSTYAVIVTDGSHGFGAYSPNSGSSQASAECIIEAPTVAGSGSTLPPLSASEFGSAYTHNLGCSATINGTSEGVGSFAGATAIEMIDSTGNPMVTDSRLSGNGTSFVATWQTSS